MRRAAITAALLLLGAAPAPRVGGAGHLYVVNCDGTVDAVDLAARQRTRTVDVAAQLPIRHTMLVAGATFDGCLLNGAAHSPGRPYFFTVVPDQTEEGVNGRGYHLVRVALPSLRPTLVASLGRRDDPPRLKPTPDGSARIAGADEQVIELAAYAPEHRSLLNQVLARSGDGVLVRLLATPSGPNLAVANIRRKTLVRLRGLVVDATRHAFLAPGGEAVLVEGQTGRQNSGALFLYAANTGNLVRTTCDNRVRTATFVTVTPSGDAVYRSARYVVIGLGGRFTDQDVVETNSEGPGIVFWR